LKNCVPQLFVIVPLSIKNALTDPESWLRSEFSTRYFVCIHGLKAIEHTASWIDKVAPVLAMSMFLLQRRLGAGEGIDLGLVEAGVILKMGSTRIAELLEQLG
jgi:hypothetical protein